MNENTMIHETIIRDIIDLIDTGSKMTDDEIEINPRASFKSISHATNKLTLVFPLMVDRDLNIKTDAMCQKGLEKNVLQCYRYYSLP